VATDVTGIPLIPRELLLGKPDREAVRLSPDGTQLAWLAPLDGVQNIWVAPRDQPQTARPVTHATNRNIFFYLWAYSNAQVLYVQDLHATGNWRLYCVDLTTQTTIDLTPFEGVTVLPVQPSMLSPKHPEFVVVRLNQRRPEWHDLYRIHLASGELTLLEQNDQFVDFIVDDDLRPRLALRATPDGGQELFRRTDAGGWAPWDRIPGEDALTTRIVDWDKAGRLLLQDSRGRNTAAVVAQDVDTRQTAVLAEDRQADAQDVLIHPTEKHVQAVSFVYARQHWQILDPAIAADLYYLATVADGELEIVSRARGDQWWVVLYGVDDGPACFYLYDRQARRARFLFSKQPALEGQPLVKMHSAVIPARDGLELVAYYSLPAGSDTNNDGIPDAPLPLVFLPHGGPWGRDVWGYNGEHQWLANRGYAVLSANFRASTGLGKAFTNAGDREWGGKMLDDQIDAVRWAVAHGLADPRKVAVMGFSFGGTAALAGLAFYPETFACAVDQCGMANLIPNLDRIPPYWKPALELRITRVGDHRTVAGRTLLASHSPLNYADRIRRPLLIGEGGNDWRTSPSETEQIVAALQANGIPVTYVVYPDEGHGFARPENNLSFNALAEAFLARWLGGRCEPIGTDLQGSSLQVRAGAGALPELAAALAAVNPKN
jgi:dipeptidyl aminopeptidase/acylaminoacyl peptidase